MLSLNILLRNFRLMLSLSRLSSRLFSGLLRDIGLMMSLVQLFSWFPSGLFSRLQLLSPGGFPGRPFGHLLLVPLGSLLGRLRLLTLGCPTTTSSLGRCRRGTAGALAISAAQPDASARRRSFWGSSGLHRLRPRHLGGLGALQGPAPASLDSQSCPPTEERERKRRHPCKIRRIPHYGLRSRFRKAEQASPPKPSARYNWSFPSLHSPHCQCSLW
ncbi:unnamed protein product [Ixodes pacificus]